MLYNKFYNINTTNQKERIVLNIKDYKHIHLIGIGGISMSAIAEILKYWGILVTGSVWAESEITSILIKNGIKVTIGSDLENAAISDLIVYSAAISQDNPELILAREKNIPTLERADFLGEITKLYKETICIAGTHGKTTTTSMIGCCFLADNLDPNIQVGAILKQLDSNYKIGNSDYFILEACEYVESFLKFYPKSAIILNIDNDHLDYFKNFDNIKNAFIKFVKLLPNDGLLVVNADDENCLTLNQYTNANFITYGINNTDANFVAKNITFDDNGFAEFDVYYNNNYYDKIKLSVPGNHNVLNALAAISLSHQYGLSKNGIKKGLLSFTGAHRRFEFVGKFNDTTIYDDYAHHPTEIKATFNSLSNKKYNESWVIFQPHTYSRTQNLLKDFAVSLKDFDNIIITDIYAAREKNEFGISSLDLVNEITKLGKSAKYISEFSDIVKYLKENAKPNDIVITLGAGTITNLGKMLV